MDKIYTVSKSLIPRMINYKYINKRANNDPMFVKLRVNPNHGTEINLHVSEKPEPCSYDCTMQCSRISDKLKAHLF